MILKKIRIKNILLRNRFVVSPMCQYSAKNGCPSKWHYKHLDQLSSTGAGLLMIESTAINKAGRITHNDLCLFNKKQELELKKLINFLKKNNNTKIGLQLNHSGRKGSSEVPWIKLNTSLKKRKWLSIHYLQVVVRCKVKRNLRMGTTHLTRYHLSKMARLKNISLPI